MNNPNLNEQLKTPTTVGSGDLLGIAARSAERLGKKQWSKMDDLSDADFREEILKAVHAAWSRGMEEAAEICEAHARTGNPEGWTDSVSRDCKKLILKRMCAAAMPNEKS